MKNFAFSLVLLLAGLWILLSPAYVQVFGGASKWVRGWQMYHERGVGLFRVRWLEGEQVRGRVAGDLELRDMIRRRCKALGAAPELRGDVEQAGANGWISRFERSQNLCEQAR